MFSKLVYRTKLIYEILGCLHCTIENIKHQHGKTVDWYNYYSSENLQVGDIARMTLVHQPLVVNYTDQPTGTIFEETDTGKHYILDSSDAWNEIV